MPLAAEPRLEIVTIGDVAVVCTIDVGPAADFVRLGVGIVDRAEGGPADLSAENRALETDDPELLDHHRRRADAFPQDDRAVVALNCGTGRVVTAVLERLQQLGGNDPEILPVVLADESDDSAHEPRFLSMKRMRPALYCRGNAWRPLIRLRHLLPRSAYGGSSHCANRRGGEGPRLSSLARPFKARPFESETLLPRVDPRRRHHREHQSGGEGAEGG